MRPSVIVMVAAALVLSAPGQASAMEVGRLQILHNTPGAFLAQIKLTDVPAGLSAFQASHHVYQIMGLSERLSEGLAVSVVSDAGSSTVIIRSTRHHRESSPLLIRLSWKGGFTIQEYVLPSVPTAASAPASASLPAPTSALPKVIHPQLFISRHPLHQPRTDSPPPSSDAGLPVLPPHFFYGSGPAFLTDKHSAHRVPHRGVLAHHVPRDVSTNPAPAPAKVQAPVKEPAQVHRAVAYRIGSEKHRLAYAHPCTPASSYALPVAPSFSALKPLSITVLSGDSLFGIADWFIHISGDALTPDQVAVAIFKANRPAFSNNDPSLLMTGSTLVIPAVRKMVALSPAQAVLWFQLHRWTLAHG